MEYLSSEWRLKYFFVTLFLEIAKIKIGKTFVLPNMPEKEN